MLSPLNSRLPSRNESWLSVWPGVCQTSSSSLPTRDLVALVDQASSLTGGISRWMFCAAISAKVLMRSPAGQRLGRQGMADDLVLSNCLSLARPWMWSTSACVAISVLQLREREVELADQLDDLVDRLVEADVDQQPLGAVVDQIDVAAQPLAGLVRSSR